MSSSCKRIATTTLLLLLLATASSAFDEQRVHRRREQVRDMFRFSFDSYMKFAFPLDELASTSCRGRGPDYADASNLNINDVLGNYSVTLIDSLDTLAVMGDFAGFGDAVRLVIAHVSFDNDVVVQVFEATIRVLGGLLAAHLIIVDPDDAFRVAASVPGYKDELLSLSYDLGQRLLPAFRESPTGIPFPRVNLRYGVPKAGRTDTNTAAAGSLSLEFGMLSRLTGDWAFETASNRAIFALWRRRSKKTGLVGSNIDIKSGKWLDERSSLGAGIDSFVETLFKAYVLFGRADLHRIFRAAMNSAKQHLRKRIVLTSGTTSGRLNTEFAEQNGMNTHFANGSNSTWLTPPLYINVNMNTGETAANWIDAMSAAMPAVLFASGEPAAAARLSRIYETIWLKYGALPERYNFISRAPQADMAWYPLRPELAESVYFLWRGTRDPYYLIIGEAIIDSIEGRARTKCGYATIHNVNDPLESNTLEDRMESFFLAETLKYLYLLFDNKNPLHSTAPTTAGGPFVLTTQAHIFRRIQSAESAALENLATLRAVLLGEAGDSLHESDSGGDAQRLGTRAAALQRWISGAWKQLSGSGSDLDGGNEEGLLLDDSDIDETNATTALAAEEVRQWKCAPVHWRQRLSGAMQPIERALLDDFVAGGSLIT